MKGRRLALFMTVGAIGFAVQLGAAWMLTAGLRLHYLAATLAATEIAIVFNFVGHESWTWSDRSANRRETSWRLVRFHATNGAISLVGGALVVPLLVDLGQLHYLLANAVSVGVCSILNFLAADRLVFTRDFRATVVLFVTSVAVLIPVEAAAVELRTETAEAFDRYVTRTESRVDGEIRGQDPFLWVDRLDGAARPEAYKRLAAGEILIDRVAMPDSPRPTDVPHGLMHHWVGTVYVPGATVERSLTFMQDYDRYQSVYSPNVRRSRTISREGDDFTVYLQLFMKKVIGVVLNTENHVRYRRLGATRAYVRSRSIRIAEVRQVGASAETEDPVGRDNGFLWRFNNYCLLDERSGGTYIQCESLSLSRTVPMGLGWLVGPFVMSIPRETLDFTLTNMRAELTSW